MSEQSSMFRHPFSGSEGPLLNLQQGGDRLPDPLPSMARPSKASKPPTSSHSQASHFPPADDEEMDAELWYACAGPQHTLPPVNSLVAYFPQGHIEQVASFNNPDVEGHVPRYDLPAAIPCTLNDIRLSADPETDEVFATLTLCPVSDPVEESIYSMEPPVRPKQKSISFTKTLTVSDTSTHGGFSVPRRGAEDCFPPLDKSQDNPIQDLVAKDLHGNEWKFRHLFRGQPKRHLLTTGWSVFVSQKRLVAGDAVLFLRDEDGQLRIAVRLAPRQQKQQAIVVTSTMAIGVLEAAAYAASVKSRFSLIYNPRSCLSQFVIPYSKYVAALKVNFTVGQRVKSEFAIPDAKYLNAVKNNSTVGHRSRTRFESDEASDCRYTGTIIDISDYDHGRWPGSVWRSLQVNWDESSSQRQERISPWEVSPFTQRASLPPQDRTRKRYKAAVQVPMAQHGPAMALHPGMHFSRPDPLPAFGSLPGPGLQDLLGFRCMDIQQAETVDFGVQVYRNYKTHCDLGTSLQPSSPRPATLHSFVKPEPLSDADLQLRVSSPGPKEQGNSKLISSHQPSLAALRDPPGWPTSFRPYSEARCLPTQGRTDCTALSMSNLPPDPESSSHPSTPKSNFWDSQVQTTVPVQAEYKCRIFGVSLDKPATPAASREASSSKAVGVPDELSSNSNDSSTRLRISWQRSKEAEDWQLKMVHEQGGFKRFPHGSKYEGYGELLQEVKHMSID